MEQTVKVVEEIEHVIIAISFLICAVIVSAWMCKAFYEHLLTNKHEKPIDLLKCGLEDVQAGRVRPLEDVKKDIEKKRQSRKKTIVNDNGRGEE